jgi:hypothetical protein
LTSQQLDELVKMFFVPPTNWQGEEISISYVEASWGPLWKEKNKFEEFF